MWRHFPHHTHARSGDISDVSTSVMRRNLKLLHMWRKFRFLHICHVEKFEITPRVEFYTSAMHRTLKFLHMTNFFSTDISVGSVTNLRYVWRHICPYIQDFGVH